ncbi:MAG: diphthamide synthesis protein [archaeon]
MKVVHITTSFAEKVMLPQACIAALPETVALFTTAQFITQLDSMQAQLKKLGKRVVVLKTKNTRHPGQLYGCNIDTFTRAFDAFLYVGDGLFHPQALLLRNDQPVFFYNPLTKKHGKLDASIVEMLRKQQKGALLKFLSSTHVGVLVSTKPGQNHYRESLKLQEKYPDKTFYYLVANTIDFSSLEDFSFIECFVNTACPRIGFDDGSKFTKPVVNLFDVLER